MDNNELQIEIQKFSDANNLGIDASVLLQNMDAGDFIALNQAIDNSDNVQIVKIIQKYKAELSESYKDFSNSIVLSESKQFIKDMSLKTLKENYHRFCSGAISDISHLSLAQLQTLVYEDMNSNINSAQSNFNAVKTAQNNQALTTSTSPNQETENKLKADEILRKGNSSNFKVQVPGSNGNTDISNVVGIDVGQNPQNSLVVTKDPNKAGNVQVFDINDVSPVNESEDEDFLALLGSIPVLNENYGDELEVNTNGNMSPLNNTYPDWTDVLDSIDDANSEPDVLDGSVSIQGNETNDHREEYSDIIDFCRKLN